MTKNWSVSITCVDCGSSFDVPNPSYSNERLEKEGLRLILLTVPNECPRCHNLRVVEQKR
jgi:hypothetical protein